MKQLVAYSIVFAFTCYSMENPVQVAAPTIKKYACCPHAFGYLGMLDAQPGLLEYRHIPAENKRIRLCTLQETHLCDDIHYSVAINVNHFMSLISEILRQVEQSDSCPDQFLKSKAIRELLDKIKLGKISYPKQMPTEKEDPLFVHITRKDLVHRILPFIPAKMDQSESTGERVWKVILKNLEVSIETDSCIHRATLVKFRCNTVTAQEILFGNHLHMSFSWLLNSYCPTLRTLCLDAVAKHRKEQAMKILPIELKEQLPN